MGDAGEGLVDAESRVQERMEELERERAAKRDKSTPAPNPELARELESLRLMRSELDRQLQTTEHPQRKAMLTQALFELDRKREGLMTPIVVPKAEASKASAQKPAPAKAALPKAPSKPAASAAKKKTKK